MTASVPAGMSRGRHEAHELRDSGSRLGGRGVLQAVDHINTKIQPLFIGREPNLILSDAQLLQLDGTQDKSALGANTLLAVSMAMLKAQAQVDEIEPYELIAYLLGLNTVALPCPMLNIINGGAHAHNNLRIQEFMVVPVGMSTFRTAFEASVTVFHCLQKKLQEMGRFTGIGDEGGISAQFKDDYEALDLLSEVVAAVEDQYQGNIVLALDVAATQFYQPEKQVYRWHDTLLTSDDLITTYAEMAERYPLYALEDGLAQDDWGGWQQLAKELSNKVQLIGDDIFVTNPQRIWRGIEAHLNSAVIIKPNQIGTMTEALQAVRLCQEHDQRYVVSHRSGETNDSLIADLGVGTSAALIKAGGCCRGERLAKYNRLMSIEDDLLLSDNGVR